MCVFVHVRACVCWDARERDKNCELKPQMLVLALPQFLGVCLNKLQFPEERLAVLCDFSRELSNSTGITVCLSHIPHGTLT